MKQNPRLVWQIVRVVAFLGGMTVLSLAVLLAYRFRDRSPSSSFNLSIKGDPTQREHQPHNTLGVGTVRVGFAKANISPSPEQMLAPIWMAGFSNGRSATSIHDDLYAVACVVDDGHARVAIVALDAIGFFHDDVLAVRREIAKATKLDYVVVCSTHNHSTPDLMGLWGKDILHTGVNSEYRKDVIAAAARSVVEAVGKLEEALIMLYQIPAPPDGLVTDTRKPVVFDSDLRMMLFVREAPSPTNVPVIGSLVSWANHPETPWGDNRSITADFPGYLRDALEKGVEIQGQRVLPALGGTHLYINGAVGGLMTTSPDVTVHDPFLDRDFKEPSHEKTRALGRNLARRVYGEFRRNQPDFQTNTTLSIHAKTVILPMDNENFVLAGALGLIDRGHVGWRKVRTEVAILELGDASITCIPGEVYPELVNGGIERAPGGDFDIEPIEVPPIRQIVPGRVQFICGLANDELGYIIPKSEWDEKPPYIYGAHGAPYGEVNSLGPDTARLLHEAVWELARAAKN